MKKIFASLVSIGILAAPLVVFGQWPWSILTGQPPAAPATPFMIILDRLTNWLFAILLVIAAIAIIIAGYYFVTATGDPDKTKKARDFVLYALIGVLIAFAAKGLVMLVEKIAG